MVPVQDGTGQPFIFQPFSNHSRVWRVSCAGRRLFRPGMGDETNLQDDETIFRIRENRLKRTLGITWLTKRGGRQGP
jgi:hypothetical protein